MSEVATTEPLAGDAAAAAAGVSVARPRTQVIDGDEAFRELRPEWNELLRRSPSDCLFLTWEWMYHWWRHLGDGRLSILAVRLDDELVGLAPLRSTSKLLPRLEFLATGTVGSDYLDLIVAAEHQTAVIEELADWLDEAGSTLSLSQARTSGSLVGHLAALLSARRWELSSKPTNVCPYIDLSGHSWSSYLKTLSSSHRANFRRRLRKLEKDYDVDFELASSETARRDALDRLVDLHLKCWGDRGGSDAFPGAAVVDFHHDVSRDALERDWLRLYLLKLDGRPAAGLYGFLYDGRFLFYQSGFDPDFADYSVGLVTMGLAIRSAIEDGAREYDLLHGDERYKSHWASEAREIGRFEAYAPGVVGTVLRQGHGLARSSKRLVGSLLPDSVVAAIAGDGR